jgi:hypothetical protein
MARRLLIGVLILIGGAMVVTGWVLGPDGYPSSLLLQLGSTLLLVAPLVYAERVISRQLGEVRDGLAELRRQTRTIATVYERTREEQASGAARTAELEAQISKAREGARTGNRSAAEVAALFKDGSDGERIAALGLMQGNHELADASAMVDGIARSRSAFEQWHALLLALELWDTLGEPSRTRILDAIGREMEPGGYIEPGTDRYGIARVIQSRAEAPVAETPL